MTLQHYDAVIFDMDGVLIDSEPLHFAALTRLLAADGLTLTQVENEQFIGTTTELMFDTLIRRYALRRSIAEYTALYDAAVLRVLAEPHQPEPGVIALIARLRDLGKRLAVASSASRPWIDVTLTSIGLSAAFEVIASGDEVVRSKPDPEIYTLAAERLGVAADRCVAIEDSPNGVQSACRAGMFVLGVRTPYTAHLHLDGASRVVNSLADLELSHEVFP